MLGFGRFGGIVGSFLVAELSRRQFMFSGIFAIVAVPGIVAALALLIKQSLGFSPWKRVGSRMDSTSVSRNARTIPSSRRRSHGPLSRRAGAGAAAKAEESLHGALILAQPSARAGRVSFLARGNSDGERASWEWEGGAPVEGGCN